MTTVKSANLIAPYGNGALVDLMVQGDAAAQLRAEAAGLPSIQISDRSLCDLQMLATGAFTPLNGFLGRADYERVLGEMRLANGVLFPIPVTLPVADDAPVALDRRIALRNGRNELLAVMTVEEIYETDVAEEAQQVFGTQDSRHPLVAEMHRWGRRNVAGKLEVVHLAMPNDFRALRRTPAQVRALLQSYGRENVVAFQTRNPLHRVHEELTKRAIEALDAVLLLHPTVGMTKPGDVDHYTRVRTYKALAERHYDPQRILLSLLPLAMRMAGPREAVWHSIIRRNHGATHFIVGRDHASPGVDSTGKPFYGPYDAQELVKKHEDEIGVKFVAFHELVYLPDEDRYEESSKIPAGARTLSISGTAVREQYLDRGRLLPGWFSRPEVAAVLAQRHPPRHRQGVCIWFTGLSGAGKSTTAEALTDLLLEHGRAATVLDGDVVRTHLSAGLGFSKEDRDTNIRRIGYVASEIVRHGGIAICAAVSPYRATREDVRSMFGDDQFVEVFMDTPLSVCETRDVKGMYAKARRGEIANFTGINDPYEAPQAAEITLETTQATPLMNATLIIDHLVRAGFLAEGVEA